jgi:hypothetical protein
MLESDILIKAFVHVSIGEHVVRMVNAGFFLLVADARLPVAATIVVYPFIF